MALVCTFGTQLGALAFWNMHRALCGYPRQGTRIGGGIHVPMPSSDPGLVGVTNGWTVRHRRFRRKIANGTYGWVVDAVFQALAADPEARARLSGAQLTLLDNNLATATNDSTWDATDGTIEELDP